VKTFLALAISVPLALTFAGCIAAPVVPPTGLVYTDIQAPLTFRAEPSTKRGTASTSSILGLFAWGDGGVNAAAHNGAIHDVKQVEYEFLNVIGVYQRYTTVVYGD
jgi:TRL-like protein family